MQVSPGSLVVDIGIALVQSNSFANFLRKIMSSLSTSTDVGQLEVSSNPSQARITIDNKVCGYTFSSFVISAGKHRLEVDLPNKKCKRDVIVTANQTTAAACP
jgi:hypothetical protein